MVDIFSEGLCQCLRGESCDAVTYNQALIERQCHSTVRSSILLRLARNQNVSGSVPKKYFSVPPIAAYQYSKTETKTENAVLVPQFPTRIANKNKQIQKPQTKKNKLLDKLLLKLPKINQQHHSNNLAISF